MPRRWITIMLAFRSRSSLHDVYIADSLALFTCTKSLGHCYLVDITQVYCNIFKHFLSSPLTILSYLPSIARYLWLYPDILEYSIVICFQSLWTIPFASLESGLWRKIRNSAKKWRPNVSYTSCTRHSPCGILCSTAMQQSLHISLLQAS